MTAMDIWMFICMIFVALAKFEYAVQLKIRFGTINKISSDVGGNETDTGTEEKCRKIDHYALRILFFVYIMTVASYFYFIQH